jgi:hypothetical protein
MINAPMRRESSILRIAKHSLAWLLVISISPTGAVAQVAKKPLMPTERLIRRYEKLIAAGDLLTLAGWKRASKLFEQSGDYPANGEIQVISIGGLVGQDWVHRDRAQVETKWNDDYGTIDSALRFKPPLPNHGSVMMGQVFSLVFVRPALNDSETAKAASSPADGEWKFEGSPRTRSATVPEAIKYIEKMRDQSNDPAIRKNAGRTLAALRRLMRGHSSACAC